MNTVFTADQKAQGRKAILAWAYDASHAWLVVSLDDEYGFPAAKNFCSKYSYVNLAGSNFAGDVYLEEDCDAAAFLAAVGVQGMQNVQEFELPEDHIVRTWPRGTAQVSIKTLTTA